MNYSVIVPSPLQDELISIRDRNTLDSFRIGDIVNQVIVHCAENRYVVERMEIYSAVGMFVGKSSRTIREYNYLSMFFPYNIRERYPTLSIDHFRTAARMGERWQEALDWAVISEGTSRPATVDAMEGHFAIKPVGVPSPETGIPSPAPVTPTPPPEPDSDQLELPFVPPIISIVPPIPQEEHTHQQVIFYCNEAISRLNNLRNALDLVPELNPLERMTLTEAVNVINNIIKKHVNTSPDIHIAY